MENIFNFFIYSKGWQLILLNICLLCFIGILYFFKVFSNNIPFFCTNNLFVLFWLYSVGNQLNKKILNKTKMLSIFKLISIGYLFVMVSFLFGFKILSQTGFIFFNTFAFGFLVYFVAKSIVDAEMLLWGNSDNFLGVFAYIWVFPIGIWFIQPRVKKIFKKT